MNARQYRKGIAWAVSFALIGAVAATLLVVGAGSAAAAKTCNLTVNSENSANDSIQTAINSADPGWTVCIGAGTFPEQLSIHTAGLKISGASAATTVLAPSTYATNAYDYDNSPATPVDALILVDNTTGVTVTGLTVTAADLTSSIPIDCAVGIVGVEIQNSSATLSNAAVKDIQNPAAALGCQEQLGVYAYTGYFGTGYTPASPLTVKVLSTSVSAYGKNGITCDDPMVACTLQKDTVTGIGDTDVIAQNGIQIAYAATASLLSDTVLDNAYTGSGSTLDWYGTGYQGSGVLFYEQGAGSLIQKSTFTNNAFAIAVLGATNSKIIGNTLTNSSGYAIVVNTVPGTQTLIANNTITNTSAQGVGILVDNGTFNVSGNKIYHAQNTGANGASQVVCGTGSYLNCATTTTIATAAIQAVSESGAGPTDVSLFANTFRFDSHSLATRDVNGGSVSVDLN